MESEIEYMYAELLATLIPLSIRQIKQLPWQFKKCYQSLPLKTCVHKTNKTKDNIYTQHLPLLIYY